VSAADAAPANATPARRAPSDAPFFVALGVLGGVYLLLIVGMLAADALITLAPGVWDGLDNPNIRSAIWLSLTSSTASAILSVWSAVPLGYLLSRFTFPGKRLVDALLDVPIVLPPLVIGLSLLLLFETVPRLLLREAPFHVAYTTPGVVLAQYAAACAFAVRAMRVTFDQIPRRREDVAMTLGCSRGQAFWRVALPEARRGVVAAFTLAWARSLGEFGPVMVFAGAMPARTEVMATTVFLELSVGRLKTAVAVSLLMVLAAVVVLIILRVAGGDKAR
jgi:molybdate transport system permease protein